MFGDSILFLPIAAFAAALAMAVVGLIWVASRGRDCKLDRNAALAVLSATLIWATCSAFRPGEQIVQAAEIVRNLAWLWFLFRCFAADWRSRLETLRLIGCALVLVEVAKAVLIAWSMSANAGQSLGAPMPFILHMLTAAGILLLVHDLYVGASHSSRRILRNASLAALIVYAFDLNYYAVLYFLSANPAVMETLRGGAAVAACAFLMKAFGSTPVPVELRPSRFVASRAVPAAIIALYLLALVALFKGIDLIEGDISNLLSALALALVAALGLWWFPSRGLRIRVREAVRRKFLGHRFDYRAEWLRLVATVSHQSNDSEPLHRRAIRALAAITESEGGVLFTKQNDGSYSIAAHWHVNDNTSSLPFQSLNSTTFEVPDSVVDCDRLRTSSFETTPNHLLECACLDEAAWAIVPLRHFEAPVGFAVLGRPPVARSLDVEDMDILRVAGTQLASYLSEHDTQEALLEARKFDDFNRRIAFVMHDIKNLSSQLTLLIANTKRHGDKPEFREDMMRTLESSASNLNRLVTRLGRYGRTAENPVPELFSVYDLLRECLADHPQRHRMRLIEREPLKAVGSKDRLRQAIAHLIQNALEASEDDALVMLDCFETDGAVRIDVVDHGCGMSAEFIRAKLFKPFESTKEAGFGIGAYEARQAVREMGGSLEVTSVEGLGSRFSIELPRAQFDVHPAIGNAA